MRHGEHPKTILLATDFSENAAGAAAWARSLAAECRARLVVVHALLPNLPAAPEFVTVPVEYHAVIEASARRRLADEAASLRAQGLEVDVELAFGPSADAVHRAATTHGADLIVVGTRGHTGWRKLLLGSTAARILRGAPCPVLTVAPHAHAPGPLQKALAATDFSVEASSATKAAIDLLSRDGTRKVFLLHAYRMPNEAVHLPTGMVEQAFRSAAAAADARLEEMAAELRSTDVAVEPMGRRGYPPELILDEAEALRVDLIAIGSHNRSRLEAMVTGNTAHGVIAHAPCPVLTVPSRK